MVKLFAALAQKGIMKKIPPTILGLALVAVIGWFLLWVIGGVWEQFKLLDPKVSVGILTASGTVIAATLAIVLGKYFERKKDIEAHYREKKIEIYDEFLKEFFDLFYSDDTESSENQDERMVVFLREWQRKMILWGGQDVLSKYVSWMGHLKKGEPDAETMFMTEEFFREIRKDLGHKNNKLEKGTFIHLLLRNPELFLAMAEKNPSITLVEISEIEEKMQS